MRAQGGTADPGDGVEVVWFKLLLHEILPKNRAARRDCPRPARRADS